MRHRRFQQRPQLEARWFGLDARRSAHSLAPAVQQLAAEHADAAVGESGFAVVVQLACGVQPEIAARVMRGVVGHQQMREAPRLGGQGGEIRVAPHVAACHQERLRPQQRQCIEHAAACFQRCGAFVGVADAQAPARAVAQRGRELFGQMRGVDHHVVHAGRNQLFQVPCDQRLAAHAKQRLGRVLGQRAHALAEAGGEDQRVPHAATCVRSRPAACRCSNAANSASSG